MGGAFFVIKQEERIAMKRREKETQGTIRLAHVSPSYQSDRERYGVCKCVYAENIQEDGRMTALREHLQPTPHT